MSYCVAFVVYKIILLRLNNCKLYNSISREFNNVQYETREVGKRICNNYSVFKLMLIIGEECMPGYTHFG